MPLFRSRPEREPDPELAAAVELQLKILAELPALLRARRAAHQLAEMNEQMCVALGSALVLLDRMDTRDDALVDEFVAEGRHLLLVVRRAINELDLAPPESAPPA